MEIQRTERLQERKTMLLFIVFFYLIVAVSNLMQNIAHYEVSKTVRLYEYTPHILLILLIPCLHWLFRRDAAAVCKYLLFYAFVLPYTVIEIIKFWPMPHLYTGGDFVEIYCLLSAAIFFSKRYWLHVLLTLTARYVIVGLVLRTTIVFQPLLFLLFFALLGYLFLILLLQVRSRIDRSYEALEQLNRQLAHKQRLEQIGRLAAGMTEHIREPLLSLIAYADQEDEGITREAMRAKIRRSLELLEHVLSLARTDRQDPPRRLSTSSSREFIFFDQKSTTRWHLLLLVLLSLYFYIVDYIVQLQTHILYYLPGMCLLALVPVITALWRRQQAERIKYVLLFTFFAANFLSVCLMLWFELPIFYNEQLMTYFILSSPFFLDKRYFAAVMLSTVLSYGGLGILLESLHLYYDAGFVIIISLVTYIFLTRVLIGLRTIQQAMDVQNELNARMYMKEQAAATGEFIASLAHELRNPLASIYSFFELDQAPDQQLKQELRAEVERMLGILEALSAVKRYDAPILPHLYQMDLVIRQAVEVMQPYAEKHGVRIQHTVAASDVSAYGDRSLLMQALLNIIKNAVEASAAGDEIRIRIAPAGERYLVIEIQDQGEGMDQEALEKIYEPFYTTKENGTGLGLAISRQIIEGQGGHMEVSSSPGKGTLFRLFLPRKAGVFNLPSNRVHRRNERAASGFASVIYGKYSSDGS